MEITYADGRKQILEFDDDLDSSPPVRITEEAPSLDYDAVYTYCQVVLNENGRTYSYRTNSPDFKVGDQVYVPVGYKNQKKIGTIVRIEDFVGRDVPYPLEKTKSIIGKVDQAIYSK